jgi:hypothetical protein
MAGPNPLPMSFGMNFRRDRDFAISTGHALTVPFADIRETSQHSQPPRWLMCSH